MSLRVLLVLVVLVSLGTSACSRSPRYLAREPMVLGAELRRVETAEPLTTTGAFSEVCFQYGAEWTEDMVGYVLAGRDGGTTVPLARLIGVDGSSSIDLTQRSFLDSEGNHRLCLTSPEISGEGHTFSALFVGAQNPFNCQSVTWVSTDKL